MKPLIKKGDHNSYVAECQQLLNEHGYRLIVDGMFGAGTERAVKAFQQSKGLAADGIVGSMTWSALLIGVNNQGFHECVDRYVPLNPGQYVREHCNKIGVVIHHTVTDGNPDRVVSVWNADSRGAVGTHFVIGRKMLNGDMQYDGDIVQCMDLEESWAYHLATNRTGFNATHNRNANKFYVGIELCSYGCLEKKEGKYYTLGTGIEVPEEQVEVLETPWRTYKYWHKYTKGQLVALRKLLLALDGYAGLDLSDRPYDPPVNWKWFDLDWDALALRRKITIHSNFEYGKFDAYPSVDLAGMLKSLYG